MMQRFNVNKWMILILISLISLPALAQLPVWPLAPDGGGFGYTVDWRTSTPTVGTIPNTAPIDRGGAGAAFDGCGNLEWYALHNGNTGQESLWIYHSDGTPLLTSATPNAPGLNGVRGDSELQVVKVPGFPDEWYLIYKAWEPDNTSPGNINNGTYTPANILFSRVRINADGTLSVLLRDIPLTDGSGVAHDYTDGKAVSRTGPTINSHYLYAARRPLNSNFISLDRFTIDANGITWNANTGNVNATWWNLTIAGSPIELSPTEDRIAVVNRNDANNQDDIFIFDATAFNNTSVQAITGNNLILNSALYAPNQSVSWHGSNTAQLLFLRNFDRKLSSIEFSPNGRYLYVSNGGYTGTSNNTNVTYLGQIDLGPVNAPATYPYSVRLQVETTPTPPSTTTGQGCSYIQCEPNWTGCREIQSSYDGNLYLTKRHGPTLWVIPNPDQLMPEMLTPGTIDLSTTTEPNITINNDVISLPDQIDGFDYSDFRFTTVSIAVSATDCDGNCLAPFDVDITDSATGNVIGTYSTRTCPDTITFCADRTLYYNVSSPISSTVYTNAVVGGTVYPPYGGLFDFSPPAASCCPEYQIVTCCDLSPDDITYDINKLFIKLGIEQNNCCDLCSDPSQPFYVFILDENGELIDPSQFNISWSHDAYNTGEYAKVLPNQSITATIVNPADGCVATEDFFHTCCLPPNRFKCKVGSVGRGLYWNNVSGATSYELEITYNDPVCCEDLRRTTTGIIMETHIVSPNSLNFVGKFIPDLERCFSWRVRSLCNGISKSDWTQKLCSCDKNYIQYGNPRNLNHKTENALELGQSLNVEVFPNPASDQVQVRLRQAGFDSENRSATFVISDVLGRTLHQSIIQTNDNMSLDVSQFTAGVYIYWIEVDGEPYSSKRLIIE